MSLPIEQTAKSEQYIVVEYENEHERMMYQLKDTDYVFTEDIKKAKRYNSLLNAMIKVEFLRKHFGSVYHIAGVEPINKVGGNEVQDLAKHVPPLAFILFMNNMVNQHIPYNYFEDNTETQFSFVSGEPFNLDRFIQIAFRYTSLVSNDDEPSNRDQFIKWLKFYCKYISLDECKVSDDHITIEVL